MVRKTRQISDLNCDESDEMIVPEGHTSTGTSGSGSGFVGLVGLAGSTVATGLVYKQMGWRQSLVVGVSLLIGALLFENTARKGSGYRDSFLRPSVALSETADLAQTCFKWLGFKFGQITDIFYWIYEYLAEDLINILSPLGRLLMSWTKFFKGYYDYFTSGLTWISFETGILGTGLVIVCLVGVLEYTGYFSFMPYFYQLKEWYVECCMTKLKND